MIKSTEYRVSDLVIDDEYGIIDSKATVEEAARKMKELNVPDLVVLNNEEKVLGVIADFDIVREVIASGRDPKTEKVLDTMYTISPVSLETTVTEAFERMRDLHVAVVPVVEKDKLIGVCTIQDCWSFIPGERPDDVGIIAVKNPKQAEFWFASGCAILALVLGIMLPMAGITGYFTANAASLYGIPDIRLGNYLFSMFRAEGAGLLTELILKSGGIWVLVVICSYLLLIVGMVGIFSLVYVSYSDARFVKTHMVFRTILPFVTIGLIALEWILYLIAFGASSTGFQISLNIPGLIFSIISIGLILAALARDWVFREQVKEMKE
ncbi:MAG: CBS domain-containing protein [Candidatus Lokiarchaeota archaeon]|nr:CBS domain-containing protein [Candidatus Lokiarchaeota archaeon]